MTRFVPRLGIAALFIVTAWACANRGVELLRTDACTSCGAEGLVFAVMGASLALIGVAIIAFAVDEATS